MLSIGLSRNGTAADHVAGSLLKAALGGMQVVVLRLIRSRETLTETKRQLAQLSEVSPLAS